MTTVQEVRRDPENGVQFVIENQVYSLEELKIQDRQRALWLLSEADLRAEFDRIANLSKHLATRGNYEGARPLGLLADEIEDFINNHPNHR